jgi:hypothetical protein
VKAFIVLAVAALLTACGGSSEWTGEVRFKVTQVKQDEELVSGDKWPGRVSLELDQDRPDSPEPISAPFVRLDQAPPDVRVGDTLTCTVHMRDKSGMDDAEAVQTVGPCKKA